jgi:CRISPR-associated protein Cas6
LTAIHFKEGFPSTESEEKMFWQDPDHESPTTVPDDVVDVLFSLRCKSLPVDHAHALSQAVLKVSPWIATEPQAAIHTIHVAGSQNGWERPAHGGSQLLLPSRRTKLGIRIPRARLLDLTAALEGQTLRIGESSLTLGTGKARALSAETTLFARYIVAENAEDEVQFMHRVAASLEQRGIKVRKALCGKELTLDTPDGTLMTRSLMIAELKIEESIELQQRGFGKHQKMGCGIFLPHKGVEPVAKAAH